MSGQIGYRDIITNGLVLYLDAANYKSYPGSGTAWNDLSQYKNNSTLTNGPTFNSANGGVIVYDGVDDYSLINNFSKAFQNSITQEVWIYHNVLNTTATQRYFSIFRDTSPTEVCVIRTAGYLGAGSLHFYFNSGTNMRSLSVANQLLINNWYQVVGTWDGTNQRIYKNGVQVTSTTWVSTSLNTGNTFTGYVSSNGESLNGRFGLLRVYNKALSAAEVLQNYNSTKARFGL